MLVDKTRTKKKKEQEEKEAEIHNLLNTVNKQAKKISKYVYVVLENIL
jgi:hypothetical protein